MVAIAHDIVVRAISGLIFSLPIWIWKGRQKKLAAIQQRRQLAAISICALTASIAISSLQRQ